MNDHLPVIKTAIFIHSISLYGKISTSSSYKVGFAIQSREFLSKEKVGTKKIIHFDEKNHFDISQQFPQNIYFKVFFYNKNRKMTTKAQKIVVENPNFNFLESLLFYFSDSFAVVITVYIWAKPNNKIILDGFPLITPSLEKCVRITNNVFSLNDDFILKEIRLNRMNHLSDESMR